MNETDFNKALENIGPAIIKELSKLGGDTSQAEDAYHDACISALKRGSRSFATKDKLKSFLAASAHGDLITRRGRAAYKASEYHDTLSNTITSPSPESKYIAQLDINKLFINLSGTHYHVMVELLEER